MAKLIVDSAGETREVRLADPCRIGRDAENDIELKDTGASRRHCRIAHDGEGWILEDLRSANGTFKNEERIDRSRLSDGDVIRVGTSTMRFVAADAAVVADEIDLELEEPAAAAGYRLIGALGEVRGRRVDIQPPRLTMGRKATNTIPLNDTKVSGVHAEIVYEGGKPVLRDLGSTNGTFLEGKRIDEIALSHGDRFGLGECVFVVADVTQPEPPLEREDNEGERTIVDAPAFRRVDPEMTAKRIEVKPAGSSMLGLLGLLVLVAGIAGAGWYAINLKAKAKSTASAPPAPDNLLGERWSFETTETSAPAAEWNLAVFGGRFTVATTGSHSGEAHLAASLESEVGSDRPVAELRLPLESSSRRFQIKGFARARGEATALLAVEFRRADDPSFHLATTLGAVRGAEWTEIAGEVVAPSDADKMVLQLIGAGSSGEVGFDDLSVVMKGSERPQNQTVSAFEVERFGDSMLVRRNGETLLRILPLALIAPPLADETAPRRFDGGMFRSGNELHGPLGVTARVETKVTPETKKVAFQSTATFDAARAGSAVLPIDLRGALLDVDVYVVSEQRGLEPYRESFDVNGVSAIVVGRGATRMRIALEPPSHVKAIRDDQRIALDIDLASGRPLSIVAQVDFVDEMVDASHARDEAAAAFARGAYGETLMKLKDIRAKYAFDENAVAAAETLKQKVEVEIAKLTKACAQAAERARYLQSAAVFVEAEQLASAAATKLEGTEEGAAPLALAKELGTEREALTLGRAETEAKRLLARMRTALAQEPKKERVARAILEHLELQFPTSEATAQARLLVGGK